MKHAEKSVNSVFKLAALLIAAASLGACANNTIITMDEPVEQLNDLKDYDKDGVIKARDRCEKTVLGARIDNYGCGTQISVVEPLNIDVKFEHNSYELPLSAYAEIKKIADFLAKNAELSVQIEGHTSKVGSAGFNQVLSENRAKAVVSLLTNEFNVLPSRVSWKGYGFDRPLQEGESEQVHAANRRIMAQLSYTDVTDVMQWTIYTVDEAE